VEGLGPIENYSSDIFSDDEIHKIAILDLRIMNLDRNACNILVKLKTADENREDYSSSPGPHNSEKYELIPIDHGMSIPDKLTVNSFDLFWLSCEQAEHPFSKKSLDFIRGINIMSDILMLEQSLKFRPECLRNIRISSTLLKKGAEAGLTLEQIGKILCRPDEDEEAPSILETIVKKARRTTDMQSQIRRT